MDGYGATQILALCSLRADACKTDPAVHTKAATSCHEGMVVEGVRVFSNFALPEALHIACRSVQQGERLHVPRF